MVTPIHYRYKAKIILVFKRHQSDKPINLTLITIMIISVRFSQQQTALKAVCSNK